MRKNISAILFLSVFATSLGFGIIAPLLPFYAQSFGATGVWIGIIFSAFTVSRALFMPMMGRLSDRYGRRNFIIIGLFLYTIFSLTYVWARTEYDLTLIRFAHGIASAIVTPVSMAYIGDTAPKGKEGEYMGIFYRFFFVGFAAGPFLSGFIAQYFYIEWSFYVMSAVGGIGFILSLLFLPESHGYKGAKNVPFTVLLKNGSMQAIFILRTTQSVGVAAFMAFIPIFACEKIGLNELQIGMLLTITYMMWAILLGPFGRISDKHNKVVLAILGSVLMTLCLGLIPLTDSFLQLLSLVLIRATGGAIVLSSTTALATQIGRDHGMGSTMGVFNTAMAVGMLLGGLSSGFIMDGIGLDYVFYAASIIFMMGIIIFWWFMKRI